MKIWIKIIKCLLCEAAWVAHHNLLSFGAIWLSTLFSSDWDPVSFPLALLILVPITTALLIALTWFCLPTHKSTLYGAPLLLIGYLLGFGGVFMFMPLLNLFLVDYVHWTVSALLFTLATLALQNLILLIRRAIRQRASAQGAAGA